MQRWVYFFKHGAELDPDKLPATLDVPVIRQAMEVLMKISQSELERQRLLEWERIERDKISGEARYRAIDEKFQAQQEKLKAHEEERKAHEEKLRAAQEQARRVEEELRAAQEQVRLARQGGPAVSSEISKLIVRIQLLQQLLKQPETSSADLGRLTETNLRQLEDTLKLQLSGPKTVNGTGPTDKT